MQIPIFRQALTIFSVFAFGLMTAHAQVLITSFDLSTLTFTNTEPGRHYRVEYQVNNRPPWIPHTNLQATGTSLTVSTPVLNKKLVMCRAVWADPSPAEPLGVWTYQGYDEKEVLRVTGTIRFSSVAPLTAQLNAVASGPSTAHITGEHTMTGELSGNQMQLSREGYFFYLKGQMVGDQFYGRWSRLSPGLGFPVPTPPRWEGGSFRATRESSTLAR